MSIDDCYHFPSVVPDLVIIQVDWWFENHKITSRHSNMNVVYIVPNNFHELDKNTVLYIRWDPELFTKADNFATFLSQYYDVTTQVNVGNRSIFRTMSEENVGVRLVMHNNMSFRVEESAFEGTEPG